MIILQSPVFAPLPHIKHGFFGAPGGVSEGVFSSLNGDFRGGDRPENVVENRRRMMAALTCPQAPLLTLTQDHGINVKIVTEPWSPLNTPLADGLVTCVSEVALGILSADCGPILFADTQRPIIGACHAGWRGALDDIMAETVKAMETLGSSRYDIVASLGPTIAQESYEVDAGFYKTFLKKEANNRAFFQPAERVGCFLFDLPGFIKKTLINLSLKTVHVLEQNTVTGPFFSRRRMFKNKETNYGCGLSIIMLSS